MGRNQFSAKTELSHGMILCGTSVPRPKLNLSYRELVCRGMLLVHCTEPRHERVKIATSSFFTQKWVFKRKETKMAKGVLTFGDLQACGCARVWDFEEIEAKIGALEEIWSFNNLVFFFFIFLSFLMSFMAIHSPCICAFILTMSS